MSTSQAAARTQTAPGDPTGSPAGPVTVPAADATPLLIHDRDSKFSRSFDAVFRSESLEVIRTRVRAPQANAIAERFVRTARAECLDWLLILSRRHLEQVLRVFVAHYNGHRPHRALNLTPPDRAAGTLRALNASPLQKLRRTDRLGGLIHEYRLAA